MRYSRQIALEEIGEVGQQKLLDARVLVIGAGGLGCPVLQNLAAAGVGTIGIVDGDIIEETNLHRQLLYTMNDCGKNKAETAAQKIGILNPEVDVVVYANFFNAQNAADIFQDYHIIVDCTDTIGARYVINDVAVAKRIPVVYASIYKFEGQVSVFNYKNGPSYRCLFPEPTGLKKVSNCVSTGVLGVLPNILGAFQANEVLKIILEIGDVLSGKLLIYDALTCQTQTIGFSRNPKAIEKGFIHGTQILNSKKAKENLSSEEFIEKCKQSGIVVIDVRETDEMPLFEGDNVVKIPLDSLEEYSKKLDKNQEIVLFCQTGQRSQMALNYLKNAGFVGVFHLGKGIQSI